MIFDWILRSRKHRTNADLIGAISPKKPFSSIMWYIVLWRHLWRYRINANIKTWYLQKPNILTFTLIPSSFFSDHCEKLYRWMCITFQMPLVYCFYHLICLCNDFYDIFALFGCWSSVFVRIYKKRLLLRCIHHFKSDLINNMDLMRISGTEPSSVILSQTK